MIIRYLFDAIIFVSTIKGGCIDLSKYLMEIGASHLNPLTYFISYSKFLSPYLGLQKLLH